LEEEEEDKAFVCLCISIPCFDVRKRSRMAILSRYFGRHLSLLFQITFQSVKV
jgi:hypothetical protein